MVSDETEIVESMLRQDEQIRLEEKQLKDRLYKRLVAAQALAEAVQKALDDGAIEYLDHYQELRYVLAAWKEAARDE